MTAIAPATPTNKKPCRVCGNELGLTAIYCDKCKLPQETKPKVCVVCGLFIPEDAHRCNQCQSFQSLRRRIPAMSAALTLLLSMLTALASVISGGFAQAAAFANRHSRTSIKFLRADNSVVYVHVSNTGRTHSTLRAYRLKFDSSVPIADAWLDPVDNAMTVIPEHGQVTLGLQVRGLRPRDPLDGQTICTEIEKRLTNGNVRLEIDVDESNGQEIRKDSFRGYLIKDLSRNKLECPEG